MHILYERLFYKSYLTLKYSYWLCKVNYKLIMLDSWLTFGLPENK